MNRTHKRYPPIAIHVYQNLDGSIRFRVARFYRGHAKPAAYGDWPPKTLPQRTDGASGWYDGLDGIPFEGLYRWPELVAADIWTPVFVVGGELCVDAIAERGGVATCNAGGEGKWRDWYSEHFRGRDVILLPDADATGRAHAAMVAAMLGPYAATVRVVELEGAHDVADWLDDGHTLAELRAIAHNAPIIAGRMVQSRNSTPALQHEHEVDDSGDLTRWRERAQKAEAERDDLARERAAETNLLALPNEKMSAPAKIVAIALRRERRDGQHKPDERDAAGRPRIMRYRLAERIGCKESAVSRQLPRLEAAQIITRHDVTSFDDHKIYVDDGPNACPRNPDAVPAPIRGANPWGGSRQRATRRVSVPTSCAACESTNVTIRAELVCLDCGNIEPLNLDTPENQNPSRELQHEPVQATPPESQCLQQEIPDIPSRYVTIPSHLVTPVTDAPPGDPRADLLALVQAHSWPALSLGRAESVSGGEVVWRRFVANARIDQLCAALAALLAVERVDVAEVGDCAT